MDIDFGENGSKKLKFEAPWDWDSALGNKKFCTDSQGLFAGVNGWDVDHSKMGYGNPWFLIFINCNWFQKMVRQKWEYIHNQDVIGKVTAHIDFVTATYEIGEGMYGKIGVIGPKRMDYEKVVASLKTMMTELDRAYKKDK